MKNKFEWTLENVHNMTGYLSIIETLAWFEGQREKKLKPLQKPKHPNMNDVVALQQYIDDFQKYQSLDYSLQLEQNNIDKINDHLDILCVEYIKYESGLLNIPQTAQDKVWNMAYQKGHSSSLSEVYNYLIELVELFADCGNFCKRDLQNAFFESASLKDANINSFESWYKSQYL